MTIADNIPLSQNFIFIWDPCISGHTHRKGCLIKDPNLLLRGREIWFS